MRIWVVGSLIALIAIVLYVAAFQKVALPTTPTAKSKQRQNVTSREVTHPLSSSPKNIARSQKKEKTAESKIPTSFEKVKEAHLSPKAPKTFMDKERRKEIKEEYGEVPIPKNAPSDPAHMIGGASVVWEPPQPPPPGTGKFGLPPE